MAEMATQMSPAKAIEAEQALAPPPLPPPPLAPPAVVGAPAPPPAPPPPLTIKLPSDDAGADGGGLRATTERSSGRTGRSAKSHGFGAATSGGGAASGSRARRRVGAGLPTAAAAGGSDSFMNLAELASARAKMTSGSKHERGGRRRRGARLGAEASYIARRQRAARRQRRRQPRHGQRRPQQQPPPSPGGMLSIPPLHKVARVSPKGVAAPPQDTGAAEEDGCR